MKKIHIQAIEKVAMEKLPAPNAYTIAGTFGKEGPKYSLRADTSRTESKDIALSLTYSDEIHLEERLGAWPWRIQKD